MSFTDSNQTHDFNTMSHLLLRVVPHLQDLHAATLRLLPPPLDGVPYRVLDIGTDTGLLVERILEKIIDAQVHLVHAEQYHLDAAEDRLSRFVGQTSYELGEYVQVTLDGPYDVIILELDANFMGSKSRRTLLSAVYAALRRGGRMLTILQPRGGTDTLEEFYVREWRAMAREQGATDAELTHALFASAKERTTTLAQQLEWMSSDGFENVDCYVKFWRLAVAAGDKL
jgi:cyclopropane fatty-acyl-phospholipid synthase-like methyltransferase